MMNTAGNHIQTSNLRLSKDAQNNLGEKTMGKIFVNPLAFETYKKLASYLKKHPEEAKGDPDRDAMVIVGNICMDDEKLLELLKAIED